MRLGGLMRASENVLIQMWNRLQVGRKPSIKTGLFAYTLFWEP